MGNIEKIVSKVSLPDPAGWDPKNDQMNLPFTVELKENFHIHWQDIRIEMMPEDFENFVLALTKAYESWKKDGRPSELNNMKRYGCWTGEENNDFHKERDKQYNEKNELCHHFRKFPRTESGKLFFDSILQIEKQKPGQYHIHYKNFRLELTEERFKKICNALVDSIDRNQLD